MIDIDQIIKEVSAKTKEDKELVEKICKHVFQSTVNTMKDDYSVSDIMFNKLFRFKLKRRYKQDKQSKYTSK